MAKALLESQLIGMKDTPVLISVKRMIDIMNNIETFVQYVCKDIGVNYIQSL